MGVLARTIGPCIRVGNLTGLPAICSLWHGLLRDAYIAGGAGIARFGVMLFGR
jgi:hypothetical protein